MIYTVTLNPAVDKTGVVERLTVGGVNRMLSVRQDPGGKGINVSKSLRSLGAESLALGILGGNTGDWIARTLRDQGIRSDFVKTGWPTRVNLKLIEQVSGDTTDINEPGQYCDTATMHAVRDTLERAIKKDDIVVFSGSLPPGAPTSVYADWTALCRDIGAKVFVDADDESLKLAVDAIPYAIKPNEHELSRLCGRELTGVTELKKEGMKLLESGIRLVSVSMGARGALFLTESMSLYSPGLRVEAKSTVGAGDAMMAALAYGENAGLPLPETAKLAIALSAASVMQSGTQSADPETVNSLLGRVTTEVI